jgi:putative protease
VIPRNIPELLAPAGSLDAARAAVANGADAIYLGAEKFNARDDGAQLTLDELAQACALAHGRGVRVYLTLNTLVKPSELDDALLFLGEAIDRGVDAAIVQDIGLVRLIQQTYPGFEIHGSTQMTVHDASGAMVMQELGIERIVLARENTLDDIRAIRAAVPDLGLETFVHGALCISYSGQCYMSGMISERSANRGSCAQSCRKDYTLTDASNGTTLDTGYLISTKDLGAFDHLAEIAEAGVGCLKIEGRKKKAEYVATVTHGYRDFLGRVAAGDPRPPLPSEVQPLVQIYSRGFTPGMYVGRAGKEYITREQPDNRGVVLGTVAGHQGREILVDVSSPLVAGDGIAFEPPEGGADESVGGSITAVRTISRRGDTLRQALMVRATAPDGWRVVRSSDATLLNTARESFANVQIIPASKIRLDVQAFGGAGAPLKLVFDAAGDAITVQSEIMLAPASKRALDVAQFREQLGRLGETPFALGAVSVDGLKEGLFIPVSELNRLRQSATDQLIERRGWDAGARAEERRAHIHSVVTSFDTPAYGPSAPSWTDHNAHDSGITLLSAVVYSVEDALAAAEGGANEIVLDPFLRHPVPSVKRVTTLADDLRSRGVTFRLRTPTVVRPEDRKRLDKWLALDIPIKTGHLGILAELGRAGRDVVADYAVNCFNQATAAELFRLGAARIVPSIELTVDELGALVGPWRGRAFDVLIYGRPEGMTIEHCVLSAAFDRVTTTCRDLCVQKHTNVTLTDPAGYTFAVATDSDCRNRLLHSRPIEASEYLPRLMAAGISAFHAVFNVPGDDVRAIMAEYRQTIDAIAAGERPVPHVRELVGNAFTRGHFARAV